MRTSTAYFAGVGTVIVAVAAGLGGGYLAANVVSPHSPKDGMEVTKLERRMSAEPITANKATPQPVPYAASTDVAPNAGASTAQAEPQTPAKAEQPKPDQQTVAASHAAAPAEEKTANNSAAAQTAPNSAATQPAAASPPAKPVEQTSERTAAPHEAIAKARDVDVKRAAAEQRRAERRQRWTDKRRFQQPREQELEAVEEKVREATEPRRIRIREEAEPRDMFAEPARIEMPRIRLFDRD